MVQGTRAGAGAQPLPRSRQHFEENTNALFAKLKELRSALDEEFKTLSQKHYSDFMASLEEIEQKVVKGLNLSGIFEDLKKVQREFRETKFTKDHRAKIWERLDGAFKNVKEKRFGSQAGGDNSPMERLVRRYDGLIAAIEKMERSIKRDKDDLKFQDRKYADSEGQLEQQIRQAKIKMVEERIQSKEEKLSDMHKTKSDLERRMELQKEKDAKQEEREKVIAAREAAKAKIAEQIKSDEEARSEKSDVLEKAASAIASGTTKDKEEEPEKESPKEDSMMEAISTTMGEALEDVVDTVKAVAEVLGEKVEEVVSDLVKEKPKSSDEEE